MFGSGAPRTPGLTELRIAAALVHAVPGACLLVVRHDGGLVRVSRDEHADLDPCAFRSMVAAAGPDRADPSEDVADLDLVGDVVDQGGGIYRSRSHGGERWFATLLCPERTRAELSEDPPGVSADVAGAWLVADRALAVTVVRISATGDPLPTGATPTHDPTPTGTSPTGSEADGGSAEVGLAAAGLDAVSRWAAARCMVAELEALSVA